MTGVLLEQWVFLLVHKMCGSRLGFSGRSGNAALIARQRPILWLYVSLFLMLMKLCFRTSTCRFQEIFKTFSENPYIIKSRMRVKHFWVRDQIFWQARVRGHFLPSQEDVLWLYVSLFLMLMKLCFSLQNLVKAPMWCRNAPSSICQTPPFSTTLGQPDVKHFFRFLALSYSNLGCFGFNCFASKLPLAKLFFVLFLFHDCSWNNHF